MALPTVVIVGAGAAGVFTAYELNQQFPGKYTIRLLEAGPTIGGNVSSVSVTYGGQPYVIDAGAQFFSASAQPNYFKLIQKLGLDGPDKTPLYPAGIIVWEKTTSTRLLWIPSSLSGFGGYTEADWKQFLDFGLFVTAAQFLNLGGNWSTTVDDFLAPIPFMGGDDFRQNVVKNFLYQFVSLPYGKIGTASALYAVTYFLRSITVSLTGATFQINQSLSGLLGILVAALAASGVTAETNNPVTSVAPGSGGVTVVAKDGTITADHVVMACDPGSSATLLANGKTANPDLVTLLRSLGNEYLSLKVVMQKDGQCWMPGDPKYWEAVSTLVDTQQKSVAFSAWFGPLRPPYDGNKSIPVFKSWGSPDLDPAQCGPQFFSHTHDVLLPTVSFVKNRDSLPPYQGQNRLFFAGGWTTWFDSQEAALMSAMNVATKLGSPAAAAADQSRGVPGASAIAANVRSWVETVARQAPASQQQKFTDLGNRLA